MTTEYKALLWATAATIGCFVFFFQWVGTKEEAEKLARSLYEVCETLSRASPSLMKRRPLPVTAAEFDQEYERYLRTEARIIAHCEGHPDRFWDIEEAARKRAARKTAAK